MKISGQYVASFLFMWTRESFEKLGMQFGRVNSIQFKPNSILGRLVQLFLILIFGLDQVFFYL